MKIDKKGYCSQKESRKTTVCRPCPNGWDPCWELQSLRPDAQERGGLVHKWGRSPLEVREIQVFFKSFLKAATVSFSLISTGVSFFLYTIMTFMAGIDSIEDRIGWKREDLTNEKDVVFQWN